MKIELPANFIEAVEEKRLILFIGAGFSKNVNPNIPNWSEVIEVAAQLLDYDSDVLKIQGDYLQIAEYLGIKNKLGDLYKHLTDIIEDTRFKVSDSKPHQMLPYIDVESIYTTNWDNWIEAGFKNQQISFSKIITNRDFVSPEEFYKPKRKNSSVLLFSNNDLKKIKSKFKDTKIVKFHGDFKNYGSIVFKESHYFERLNFEHPLDLKLRCEIIGKSILFIGYSFTDMNIRYVWHKLNKMMKNLKARESVKSFFVTHFNNPLQIAVLKKKNIETIVLNPLNIQSNIQKLFETIIARQK